MNRSISFRPFLHTRTACCQWPDRNAVRAGRTRSSVLLLLAVLSGGSAFGQLTETEPNDDLDSANELPLGVPMSGVTCATEHDYFRFNVPEDGVLRVITAVSAPVGMPNQQGLELQVPTNGGGTFGTAIPNIGGNGTPLMDTLYFSCMMADAFFIRWVGIVNVPYCYSYTFTVDLLPALYMTDAEPNAGPAEAVYFPYGSITEGHLGFKDESSTGVGQDAWDYFQCDAPNDGVIRLIVEAENAEVASNDVEVALFNSSGTGLYGIGLMPVGSNGVPATDTLYYDCITAGTFYMRTFLNNAADCGISYRLRYDLLPLPFEADPEPNDLPTQAVLVAITDTVEGHLRYMNDIYDNYKVYMPDTGYLRIPWAAGVQSAGPVFLSMTMTGQGTSYFATYSAPIGVNGSIL